MSENSKGARSGRDPLEGIDFYLRSPEAPTRYTLCDRLADRRAGRREVGSLSKAQAAEHAPGDPLPPLTPWANAVLSRAGQVAAKERTVLEAVLDPARQETTRLAHAAAAADAAAAAAEAEAEDADAAAEDAAAAGPASPEPSGAAEAYDSLEVRKGRRAAAHRALVGSHRARAAAARARAAASREAAAAARAQADVLATRAENAAAVLATRLQEHAAHTRRRLNAYARPIARAHPDAAILPALAHATGVHEGGAAGPAAAPRLHAL
ncbi:hypothetical protein GCM10012320_32900 [Sinomonas cellulolyticus]|uniref:Uncharacterized protein n=1 Tax=Sinomonas cellulolyticus TaxID=2801916 RepID=A0ABS1JXT3_9MICC|nr:MULTISPECIES: hypothetical protein [Sinomonas]MBL0703983.1 hypothetical protein [Sinomonas cellulolyticus]GHG59026.1 hypothetical protein GCM10012320_32900 [Sinomonas sp. KCTC 49339]